MSKRIETFPEFARKTDRSIFGGPQDLMNNAFPYRKSVFLQAWAKHKKFETGNGMRGFIELDRAATGGFVNANHKFDIQGTDGTTPYTMDWAVYGNYFTYEKEEREMNEDDRRAYWKSIYQGKRMRMRTNTIKDFDDALFATPTLAMEDLSTLSDDTVRVPYSLPALITPSGTAPSQWLSTTSNVFGINPGTKTNWKNQYGTFSNFEAEIEGKLFDMSYLCDFQEVAVPDAKITGTPTDGMVVYADLASIKGLRNVLRNANDRMQGIGQYDHRVDYAGTAIMWADVLGSHDTAAASQKLYGVNWNHIYPVCRKGYFMSLEDDDGRPFRPHNQPRTNIIYEFTEYNLWVESRRTSFLLAYSA